MRELDWNFTPDEALARWPAHMPLAALVSGTPDERWGRITMLASPNQTLEAHSALELEEALANASTGIWLACFCYELGGHFEPRAAPRQRVPPDGWPLALLQRCEARLEYDHGAGRWRASAAAEALVDCLQDSSCTAPPTTAGTAAQAQFGPLQAEMPRAEYERLVNAAVERIRAGEIYQANLAQRFSARWSGSPRAILRAAIAAARPRYGAYLETSTHALVSMSPELFLDIDGRNRSVVTRPIKGTRAVYVDPASLAASAKDAAELHMIVDLMRNDLSRICVRGSVQVRSARQVESHETVHHGVAEIAGTLAPGTTLWQALRATFPPGSVTGAPKVRAMQVIDELEPVARGPYCGAIGLISPERVALNVAIRTICLTRDAPDAPTGILRYSAGCGIVAESVPSDEYEESLHKSAVLLRTAHTLARAERRDAEQLGAP